MSHLWGDAPAKSGVRVALSGSVASVGPAVRLEFVVGVGVPVDLPVAAGLLLSAGAAFRQG